MSRNDSIDDEFPSSGESLTAERSSSLPDLIIEKVQKPNKHDEPDEFYDELEVKMKKYWQKLSKYDPSVIGDLRIPISADSDSDMETFSSSSHRAENEPETQYDGFQFEEIDPMRRNIPDEDLQQGVSRGTSSPIIPNTIYGRFGKPKAGGRRTTAAAAEASAAASTAAPLEKSTQDPKCAESVNLMTTTTTTTTPPPTTTTAAPSTRPSRFKLRPGARGRSSTTTTTTEASETSTKVRGRFGKPKAGGRRTTAAAAEASAAASTAAPLEKSTQAPKQSFGRRGLFAGRTRPPSTTAAPSGDAATPATGDTPTPRVLLRPGLRRLPSSTAAPGTAAEAESSASQDPAETTTASGRLIGRGRPGLRPLRPGPSLNLRPSPRLRAGDAEPAPDAAAATAAPEADSSESPSSTAATEAPSRGGMKLRTRLIAPSPKPRVAVTQPPRRPNPLLKRKRASTEATTEARAKVEEETEPSTSAKRAATETDATPAETTPTPPLRRLDALFARRRAARSAGRTSRPVRRA